MTQPLPTPHHLVIAARIMLAPCLAAMGWSSLAAHGTPMAAAIATFTAALVMLQAAPRLRASDLLGGIALFATILEVARAGSAGSLDSARWQACIAVAGGMMLLLKVQHLRALARRDAYVPLRHLERRSALFGRSRARAANAAGTSASPASPPICTTYIENS
ncbi:hypothetical protein [Novosphingobium resinovorum]|uniref:hypothetical protein n=1 Tax=Novosphingobium resinovorum TaxID=158500 RepID=UPI002ED20BF1|nr:hypothetical protein [Novosphingobium resinovorum]